jgi:hypothetical protein
VPINPVLPGYSAGIQVLFFRRNNTIHGMMSIPELDSGEVANIGLDLPITIRDRIGIISEEEYQPYTSTAVISSTDTYPEAISKLDLAAFNALSDTAVEETIIAATGQTAINFLSVPFNPSMASFDLKIYRDGHKMAPYVDYQKISPGQITFNYPLIDGEYITARLEKSGISLPQPYFINYLTAFSGTAVPVGDLYNIGTDKMSIYRNGLFMVESSSGVFPAVDRYSEFSAVSVLLGFGLSPSDWMAFINEDTLPLARFQAVGLTGSVLTVPAYLLGNDSLRVYRNGVLMNSASLGSLADQYSETNSTSITLALPSTLSDVWSFYVMGTAPIFRQDFNGVVGPVINLPAPITVGDERLLVFKNGILMLNSATLATANERYQETSAVQITLAAAAMPSDVFTVIYY